MRMQQQSGAALVISLILLLVTTLLGVASMQTTVLEEKMSTNARQRQLAYQSAETALRAAETWLSTNINTLPAFETTFSGTPTELFWQRKPTAGTSTRAVSFDIYQGSTWNAANSQPVTTVSIVGQTQPRYIIEYMGRIGEPPLDLSEYAIDSRPYGFQITAIGWGADASTYYIAQSTMRLPLI